jgi:transglutaminase-like putative cysteine protease
MLASTIVLVAGQEPMKDERRPAMLLRRLNITFWFTGVVILATVICRPIALAAAEHFQPVSAEELAMKSEPLAKGAPAIILYRQVDRGDRGGAEFNYFRIKILTEEGRKQADVEIPLWKGRVDVNDLRARTIRPDGSIVNYQGKPFEKTIEKSKGWKFLAKTFTLPDVQVGSIIEYYWTYQFYGYYFRNSQWTLSEEMFTRDAKFSLRPYVSPYRRLTVYWGWQRLPAGTDPPKEGNDSIIRLEARNIPAFQKEDFMPPKDELTSHVDFVYADRTPESDEAKFWREVGKDQNELVETFITKGGWMQRAVAQIVSPGDSPEVKLQKIYSRVQQIRNTSYEVEKTAREEKRENPKEIRNVEDVWKRGYGSAGDLTWLYLGLIRAAGFEAYGLRVSDRENYFFDASLRNPYKLDAEAVQIKLNGKDIYCNPGAKFAPFGLLPWRETGVPGLRLDKQGGTWIKVPVPESSVSRIEHKAALKLSETGDLEGKLTLTLTGLEAMKGRDEERDDDEAARKKYLEDRIKYYVPAAAEVELTNHPDWNNPEVPLVAEFDLKVPGWASGVGHRVLVPVGLFSGTEKHVFEHAGRVHPIYIQFPFQKIDDVTLEIPPGWQVANLPPPFKKDEHIILYSMTAENQNGKLHLQRTLDVKLLLLQTEYYGALRNFFQQVRTGDEQQIVLQQATSTASK